jgi:hypothetical protein
MPQKSSSDKTTIVKTTTDKRKDHSLVASWTVDDIECLIDTFHAICRTHSTDDKSASFKPQAWHIVATALKGTRSKGGEKDARSCKDKWKAASFLN